MGRSFSSDGPKGAVIGKPTARLRAHNHAEGLMRRLRRGRRGFRPDGAVLSFEAKKVPKESTRHGNSCGPRPAMRNSQISAFRHCRARPSLFAQACQSLTAFGSCAHWAHAPSRPKLRSAVAPSGLSSTTVRFAHPSGKKASIAHFAGGARNVARNLVGQITPTLMRAPVLAFFRRQNGAGLSFATLSPLCSAAAWVGAELKRRGLEIFHRHMAAFAGLAFDRI